MPVQTETIFVWTAIISGAVFVSVFFHAGINSKPRASFYAAVTFVLLTFTGDVLWQGRIVGWWFMLSFVLGGVAFVTSLAVGFVMDKYGLSKRSKED